MTANPIELAMYSASQLFLTPVLILIGLLFVHAFYALGAFIWQAWQRHNGQAGGFELAAALARNPQMTLTELEALATKRMEFARIATRIAPMLGLVATMIPMGPALVAVAAGNTQGMAQNLVVAFAAVIVALLAAAITFVVQTLRKRWLMEELNVLLIGLDAAPVAVPTPAHGHAHDAVPSRATRELAHG